jgi:hypothetical protein
MDVRLVQLLASFIGARSRYTLLRLEFAMGHPNRPAPPVVAKLPDASESTLREVWPAIQAQLDLALAYAKRLEPKAGTRGGNDPIARGLRGCLREMDQYARAVQWVRTVTASEE